MKTEIQKFEEKEKYYKEKRTLTEERILLLKDFNSGDALKDNSTKLEILELEATLEGIIGYWKYYTERVQQMKLKEEELTKECELNYSNYSNMLTSISPSSIKQYSQQLQQQYNQVASIINKWDNQQQKNAIYSFVKELLVRMKKIN